LKHPVASAGRPPFTLPDAYHPPFPGRLPMRTG
jgi:hypothetical protein